MGSLAGAPALTWRQMAGLRVTGLGLPGLGELQAPTEAGRPEGTDDLASPGPRAAALGTLGPTGWAWEERTGSEKEQDPGAGGPHKEKREGENAWEAGQTQGRSRVQRPGPGPGLGGRKERGKRQALTRPQAPTRQACSCVGGQSSRTQGSVMGGRSSAGHAAAWSGDPSSLRQVTLRLRTPAPQLTEHCKDQAVGGSLLVLPRAEGPCQVRQPDPHPPTPGPHPAPRLREAEPLF